MVAEKQTYSKARSAEEMFPLIRSWEDSGLLQKEFCARHGIRPHIFYYWLRRYRAGGDMSGQESNGFISVEMEPAVGSVVLAEVIYPDGTRLVFKERVSLDLLRGLLPTKV
jgi:transposase-like protein